MKLRLFTILSILLLAITFIIAGCSKDGPSGAAGPAGPTGATGANGAAGTTGSTGATGTANVIYSDWLNVTFDPANADSSTWGAEIDAPRLVDSILNKGEIKVYWNPFSDSTNDQVVIPLPTNEPFIIGILINTYFTNGKIALLATGGNPSSYIVNGFNHSQFRYILIPGGVKAGRGVKTIDWNDYNQVKAYLGFKD